MNASMPSIAQKLETLSYRTGASPVDFLDDPVTSALPADYIQFLALFPSTGSLGADVCAEGLERYPGAPDGFYPVTMLYGFSDRESDDLSSIRALDVETPRHFLDIGRDLFGNRFLLDLRPETNGRVYFHDHDQRLQDGLYLLANSFSDFINSLKHVD